MTTLVTGGAGFIGSHTVRRLLDRGENVRVLDRLDPQTHGADRTPAGLDPRATFIEGDVRDPATVQDALDGVDRVLHLAAAVGVGQSMYQVSRYVDENTHGTAVLLENAMEQGIRRLVVASSMSIYGEGAYVDPDGRSSEPARTPRHSGRWDPVDATGAPLRPVPTPESKRPELASVYALTKYDQERLALILGQAYEVPTVALRFFNTYGPGQALQNPYTGVLAIFAARLLNNEPPLVYEDGNQLRDFVHVQDVADACIRALDRDDVDQEVINVGTGEPRSVLDVAHALGEALEANIQPQVTGRLRAGDIRHCWADTAKAQELLDFQAQVSFYDGIRDLTRWLADQRPEDRVPGATRELEEKGLIR